jgi:hypothetical protein
MAVKSASRLFKRVFLRGVRINPTGTHYTTYRLQCNTNIK